MTAAGLLDQLAAGGVTVSLAPDGSLRTRGDRDALTGWLPMLKQHRDELVGELARQAAAPAADPAGDWIEHRTLLTDAWHCEWSAVWRRNQQWLAAHPDSEPPTGIGLRLLLAATVQAWNGHTGDRKTLDDLQAQLSEPDYADREMMTAGWLALYAWTCWR